MKEPTTFCKLNPKIVYLNSQRKLSEEIVVTVESHFDRLSKEFKSTTERRHKEAARLPVPPLIPVNRWNVIHCGCQTRLPDFPLPYGIATPPRACDTPPPWPPSQGTSRIPHFLPERHKNMHCASPFTIKF